MGSTDESFSNTEAFASRPRAAREGACAGRQRRTDRNQAAHGVPSERRAGHDTDRRECQAARNSTDEYLREVSKETRSQKSGPTAGEKSGLTAGKKEHSRQQARRAYPTEGEEQCQLQARIRTSS